VVGQETARGGGLRVTRSGGREAERLRNMVHARARWPEQPQSRQRTGSRQLRTLCSGERQRKQPWRDSFRGGRGVGGGVGGAGVRRASRYEQWVATGRGVKAHGGAGAVQSRLASASAVGACPVLTGHRGIEGTAAGAGSGTVRQTPEGTFGVTAGFKPVMGAGKIPGSALGNEFRLRDLDLVGGRLNCTGGSKV
jgi:hypothetical protein